MARKLFLFLFLATANVALAHNGYLAGTILDKEKREPLTAATIYAREISTGTVSDMFGHYQLTLKPGSYSIEISYLGYRTQTITVDIVEHETTQLNVELESGAVQLSDLIITSNPVANTTNHLSRMDLSLRTVNSSQEILRMVPGLFIAQHAGGGKAEQIFLRGFDIDHGTDINITVDGMPVNMVSHAHGQGYSDLHFLIPETINTIDFDKGPYYADKGNFSTAGYVDFNTFNSLEQNTVKVEGGSFGSLRNVNMLRLFDVQQDSSRKQISLATELFRSDGYFESPQRFRRLNALIKYFSRLDDRRIFNLSLSGFSSGWNASGQIPQRMVDSGAISRFGSIDDTEGGYTSRYNLNASLTTKGRSGIFRQNLYGTLYDFNLLSNFTFFLNDPINGDRIVQSESRKLAGYQADYLTEKIFHKLDITRNIGAGIRYDAADDVRLSRVQSRKVILTDVARGDLREMNAFAFAEYKFSLARKFALTTGARYDFFSFQYQNALSNTGRESKSKAIFSPKASVEYDITSLTRVFLKAGYGFHSNDTRTILSQETDEILPRAFGIDAGTQWKPFPRLFIQSALWMLDLEQELVYVGDEGIVEVSGATRRKGMELSMRYQLNDAFFLDADLNYTLARNRSFDHEAKYIPLAPSFTTIGGVQYKQERFSALLRYRYLADRPANEDNTLIADGYFLLDANASWKYKNVTVRIAAENLLNSEWNEAQFETTSRLPFETEPVTEIHFTPGSPLSLKASLEIVF